MGMLDWLTGPETVETKSQYKPSKQERPIYDMAFSQLAQMMQNPQTYFPGQGYVGMSGNTQQGIDSMLGAAGNIGGMAPQFQQAWQQNLNAADVANNPHVQGMLQANQQSVNQNLQRNMLPAIQQGAIQNSGMNNARQGLAQGVAMGDTSKALALANASTMRDAYNSGLGASANAMGQAGNLASLYGMPAQMQLGAGQIDEGYDKRKLDDQMARHYAPYQFMQQNLGFGIPMLQSMRLGEQIGENPNPGYTSLGNIVGNIVGSKL